MKNKSKKSSVTVEVQELSPTEIKKRETTYRKDLHDFNGGLIAGERFKADGIKKLAKDLVEAGTIPKYKISIRIKSDLKEMIDRGFITPSHITTVLGVEYTRAYNRNEPKTNIGDYQSTVTTESNNETETTSTPIQQPELSQTTIDIQKHETLAQNIMGYMRAVVEKITGLNETQVLKFGRDYRTLTTETKNYRFELSKKFTDLNLKTVYDDSRTLSVLLDDFLKQLDNELGSRKKKEALTSE